MQPAARPRPRGQARGQEPAREDAGAPLVRHLLVFLKDHKPSSKFKASLTRRRKKRKQSCLTGNNKSAGGWRARNLSRLERPRLSRNSHRASMTVMKGRWRMARGKTNMIADIWQDLRYGARILMKNPGFTLIAVMTLSLGAGANTAVFSVAHAVIWRPLPYQRPEQLVMIWERSRGEKMSQPAMNATGNLFSLLGVNTALGRTFTIEDEQPGRGQVVI